MHCNWRGSVQRKNNNDKRQEKNNENPSVTDS